jgi:hypothetical protein
MYIMTVLGHSVESHEASGIYNSAAEQNQFTNEHTATAVSFLVRPTS